MKKEIVHTFYFNQSPKEVWAYLTQPELMEQWLMPSDFKPVVGHHFRFTNPNNTFVICEVLEVKPFTNLAYVWKNDWSKTKTPYTSKVSWTLTPLENGTELLLVHDGFELLKDLIAHSNGWAFLCNKLFELLKAPKQ
jgi:uncharacterized protein YndB with AHSA1/START domain